MSASDRAGRPGTWWAGWPGPSWLVGKAGLHPQIQGVLERLCGHVASSRSGRVVGRAVGGPVWGWGPSRGVSGADQTQTGQRAMGGLAWGWGPSRGVSGANQMQPGLLRRPLPSPGTLPSLPSPTTPTPPVPAWRSFWTMGSEYSNWPQSWDPRRQGSVARASGPHRPARGAHGLKVFYWTLGLPGLPVG